MTHLRMRGEEILDKALVFTTTLLKCAIPNLSNPLKEQVIHALNQSIHYGFTRLESSHYIFFYEQHDSHNEVLLNFAKLDFNLLELQRTQAPSAVQSDFKAISKIQIDINRLFRAISKIQIDFEIQSDFEAPSPLSSAPVHPEGKYVVGIDKSIDITKLTPSTRVALRNDSYMEELTKNQIFATHAVAAVGSVTLGTALTSHLDTIKVLIQLAEVPGNVDMVIFPNYRHKVTTTAASLTWWKDLDFAKNLPFARDRLVECYFWILGVYFEPQYFLARRILTKVLALTSIIDDIYDAYGTLEELELFTDAVERWESSALDQLPEYMKLCYQAQLDVYNMIDEEMV
ncbi:hypothetical protein HYC85_004013 [Camellia sinensis]|uniref:Terpene synthase metal-binding domain-containing protein n=1 Tax=Camellia sinensis TaxID=4442 RepID=A0A7J7HXY9_CAMSI|nr:hypothetical protein HYC85_004013 [Camellia sinensis]